MEWIQLYDEAVSQYAYIIGCEETREAIVFDPQRNIAPYIEAARKKNLTLVAVAETHIHADFLSGTREFLRHMPEITAYLSDHGKDQGWAYEWVSDNDKVTFLHDKGRFKIGTLEIEAVHTPGHTPEHLTYLVSEPHAPVPMGAVTGDFIFVGDLGRPDLLETAAKAKGAMKKGAEDLYRSSEKFRPQPQGLLIWPGHGAGSACGKNLGNMPHSSWGYELKTSEALQKREKDEFIHYITSAQTEPPLYFATMKKVNKEGAPPLSYSPLPRLSAESFDDYLSESKAVIIDTRSQREQAMQSHLQGAQYIPFSSMFSTAVGSVIEDNQHPIILIIEDANAAEAQRRLTNIGYDNLEGYITPDDVRSYLSDHQAVTAPIPLTDFNALEKEQTRLNDNNQIVDVRSATEYNQAHLPGAINTPYTRLPEYVERLPKDKKLFIHCGSGARASVATTWLAAHGYDVTLINDSFENAKALLDKTT